MKCTFKKNLKWSDTGFTVQIRLINHRRAFSPVRGMQILIGEEAIKSISKKLMYQFMAKLKLCLHNVTPLMES